MSIRKATDHRYSPAGDDFVISDQPPFSDSPAHDKQDIFGEKTVLQRRLFPDMSEAPLSSTLVGSQFVAGDISFIVRTIVEHTPACLNNPSVPAMGVTNAMNAIWGVNGAGAAYRAHKVASVLGDQKGKNLSFLNGTANFFQVIGGLGLGGSRPFTVAALSKRVTIGPSSSSIVGRISYFMSMIGTWAFGAYYAALGIAFGVRGYYKQQFIKELSKVTTEGPLSSVMEYLKERSEATQEDVDKSLSEADKEALGIKHATKEFKHIVKVLKKAGKLTTIPKLSDEEMKEVITNLVGDLKKYSSDIALEKAQQKKDMEMERLIGHAQYKLLKKVLAKPNLLADLKSGKKETLDEVSKFLDEMVKDVKHVRNYDAAIFVFSMLGAVFLSLGVFFTGGILGAVVAAGMASVALIFLHIDWHLLQRDLKDGVVSVKDKRFIGISMFLCVAAVATSIATTIIFAFPVLPMIVVSVIGAGWFSTNIYALNEIDLIEKKQKNAKKSDDDLTVKVDQMASRILNALDEIKKCV